MNIDPILEQVGVKRPTPQPTWLEQFARQKGIIDDPEKKEWWKNLLISPASTLTSEYSLAAALLPYKKFIERPAVTKQWNSLVPEDSADHYTKQLKHLAKKLGIKVFKPADHANVVPQLSDSFTIPDAVKNYYSDKGNLKSNWKKFNLKDILSPDKWFLRQSTKLPTSVDPTKYQHIISAPANLHPGILAKEMGTLQQTPIMQKLRTPAEILSILGISSPTVTNDEDAARKLTVAGTVAQMPLLAAEMDAMNQGSNILRRIGATGNKAHFPYLGLPNHAITMAMPSMAYLTKKHLFGGYNSTNKPLPYDGINALTSQPGSNGDTSG
mgnify:CR=1 FL=1